MLLIFYMMIYVQGLEFMRFLVFSFGFNFVSVLKKDIFGYVKLSYLVKDE